MRAIFVLIAAIALSMTLVSVAVIGLDDGSLMVPPPDSVAETFTRHLVARRYAQARSHLSEAAKQNHSVDDLKDVSRELERRLGDIYDVRGVPQQRTELEASAAAVLKTSRTKSYVARFGLNREKGLWRITDFEF